MHPSSAPGLAHEMQGAPAPGGEYPVRQIARRRVTYRRTVEYNTGRYRRLHF